jgi:membrane protein DedA with SNARE-associated domain
MGILASAGLSGPAPLPGFLNSLQGPLDHYGYGAIALLLLLENIGVPVVPGELALIAGSIFAGTGRAGLNVVGVGLVAVTAVIVGAEIGYLIGRFAGRELILHYGKYVLLKPEHLDRAEAVVSRYGGFVVIIARFIVGLREANGIIAGITQMRWLTFLIYNVIGAFAWVATWVTLGYVAGDHIATIYADVNRYFLYVLIALAVLLVAYISWRRIRRRRAGRSHEAPETQEDSGASTRSPESTGAGEASGTEATCETPEGSGTEEEEEVPGAAAEVQGGAAEVPVAAAEVQGAAAEVPVAAAEVPGAAAEVPGGGEKVPRGGENSGAGGDLGAGEEHEGQENSPSREAQPKSS